MSTQIQLPNHNTATNPTLHAVCLTQGRVAVRQRHTFEPELLEIAEDLAAAGGGFFASELGLCHVEFLKKNNLGIQLLERAGRKLGTAGLALRPHTPCLWKTALGIYAHLQRESGQQPLDRSLLKQNAYPWLATILLPEFLATATPMELATVDVTLSAMALGLLEHSRKTTQRN